MKCKIKNTWAISTYMLSIILVLLLVSLIIFTNTKKDTKKDSPSIVGNVINVGDISDNNDVSMTDTKQKKIDNEIEEINQLYKKNNDLAGYIVIPGTNINYPVMYTKGEDFYLRRGFDKKYLINGTLYIDKHNIINPRDDNLIIYGHNMTTDKTMFYDLEKFKNKNFYLEHKTFTYYTLKEKEEYEIVSVFISQVYKVTDNAFKYYKFYNATNKEEFNDYVQNIKNMGLYETDVKLTYGDKFLTLSTCEYSKENSRLVVVARRK